MRSTIYLLFTFLLLISCDNETAINKNQNLLGIWELQKVIIDNQITTPPSSVTLIFSKSSDFNGTSTCNSYGGQVKEITKKTISFFDIYSTEIFCTPQQLNTFEQKYYQLLQNSKQYSIEDSILILFSDNNSKMEFVKEF